MDTGNAGGAQVGFDLLFVALHLEFAGGEGKLLVAREHSVLGGKVAPDFVVAGLEVSGEFLDDVKIRVRAPLTHFVANDGNARVGNVVGIVPTEPTKASAQAIAGAEVRGTRGVGRSARAARIKTTWIAL